MLSTPLFNNFLAPEDFGKSIVVSGDVELDFHIIDEEIGPNGNLVEIFTAGRMVMPYAGGGCLQCNGLIPSVRLQKELLSEEERRAGNYIENEFIQEPSVITLNVLSASQVVNDFLLMFTGLYQQDMRLKHVMSYVLARERTLADFLTNSDCTHCSDSPQSRFAKGDAVKLPCRSK